MEINDTNCTLCGGGDREELLLLCDGCDKGFHTYCLNMAGVPIGDWFCPGCRKNKEIVEESTIVSGPQQHPPMNVVYIYERVSSKGQDAPQYGRTGLKTQNNVILEYALKHGLTVAGTIQEVGSGLNPKNLSQLVQLCSMMKPGECLLVHSVSRFSRNLEQGREMAQAIHDVGGWIYAVTDNVSSFDERFIQLLNEGENESRRLSQKVKDAYERIRRQGGHIGPAPFGWGIVRDKEGIRRLELNSNEQEILAQLRGIQDRSQDASQTAALLNDKGIYRRGKPWTRDTVIKSLGSLANNTFSRDIRNALQNC